MKDFFERWRRKARPSAPAPAPQADDWLEAVQMGPTEPGVPEAPPDAPIDWMAELAREMAFEQGMQHAFAQPPAAARQFSSARGFEPGMVPPDFETYQALLHQVFDGPKQRLATALAQEPYVRSAFDAWHPGRKQQNLNILYAVYERVSASMGTIYRFHPAPLGYEPAMGDAVGQYNRKHVRIMLSERLLVDPVEELFATIIHEQIHKLQHEMTMRLEFASSHPLTLAERSLVYYWVREEPRVRHYYTRAWNDIKEGRGDAAYRRIGKEYHAFDTEETVVAYLKQAFGR